ncbi:MAG: oligosaccharide flippase family protein [Lachnospiraceae bacterium]|nr:oligosaccharide flippase family protein [Lachnospiraceae bacterium]
MDRVKYLLKNMGFLALSSLSIKIISFLLVPVYTSVLSTEEYGTYDWFNTTVSLLIPFLTLNIKESTLRFSLSKNYDKKKIFSISLKYSLYSIVYFSMFIFFNHYCVISVAVDDFKELIILMFLAQSLQGLLTNFARGMDRLKDIAISGVICSLMIIILNIILLVPLHMGLVGYFIANIVGPLVQVIYLFIVCKCWKYISFPNCEKKLETEMRKYSLPLIANSTAWWVNSVSDRYIIIWLRGVAENGVYAVAGKIPSIVDAFQGIFSQAWTLSAVKEFDPEDSNGFFSKMYDMYNMCMTFASGIIIIVSRLLAKFLYSKDFFSAWQYVPFLTLAVLFGALAGYCGAIFSAVKASRYYAYSTLTGAVTNFLLNIVMVKPLGALGAAIATALSYFVIFEIRFINAKKFIKIRINIKRDYLAYLLLFFLSVLFFIFKEECWQLYLIDAIIFAGLVALYGNQICAIKEKLIDIINTKGADLK